MNLTLFRLFTDKQCYFITGMNSVCIHLIYSILFHNYSDLGLHLEKSLVSNNFY